jgi:RNA recognition motif. (a.k.a. RRM, RBD, or RNP domain)
MSRVRAGSWGVAMSILYIAGLPPSITEEYLKIRFAPFGIVIAVHLRRTIEGLCAGSATIEMATQDEIDEILSTQDTISLGGKRPYMWQKEPVCAGDQEPGGAIELLVRWPCSCPTMPCSDCKGTGCLEQWVPTAMMKTLRGVPFIIRGRRRTPP